jgi:hypothetical protein
MLLAEAMLNDDALKVAMRGKRRARTRDEKRLRCCMLGGDYDGSDRDHYF